MAKAKDPAAQAKPDAAQAGQTDPNPGQNSPGGEKPPETLQGAGGEDSLKGGSADDIPPVGGFGADPVSPLPDTGTTVKQAADMVRALVVAIRAGNLWEALRLGGELLKLSSDIGFSQFNPAGFAAVCDCSDEEKADFVAACGELDRVKDHCVANAVAIASPITPPAADSGASPALGKAVKGTEPHGLSPNDILALYEVVSSAVALIRKLIAK